MDIFYPIWQRRVPMRVLSESSAPGDPCADLFKRLNTLKLNHVRAIEGDAAFLLQHVFAPQSLSEIWINFSDPWPKERHHNRRLIQDTFVKTLAERLKPGGEVTIATDHADYATWITDVLSRQSHLQSIYATSSVHQLPGRTPTKYEQKAIDAGVPIHYFVWRQKSEPSVETHIQKVGEMPNIVLEGAYHREDILTLIGHATDQVWRETHRNKQVVIKMTDIYCQLPDNHGLISVMVREGELAQYFGISLLFRKNNQLLVKLAPMGQPRPTLGRKKSSAKSGRSDFGNTSQFVARIEHSGSVRRMVAQQRLRLPA